MNEEGAVSADQVTYWTVLSKMGRGFRGMGMNTRRDDSQDFVRFEIVLDHEFPISEGPWPVPLYLDKEWPVSYVDLVEPVDEHWPDSISGQVLGSQKAIDLLSSLRLTSVKKPSKDLLCSDARLGSLAISGKNAALITPLRLTWSSGRPPIRERVRM